MRVAKRKAADPDAMTALRWHASDMGAIGNGTRLDTPSNDGAIRFTDAEHGNAIAFSQALRHQTCRVDGLRQYGDTGLVNPVDAALNLADDRDAGSTLSRQQHPGHMTDLHRACRSAPSIDLDRGRRAERYVDVVDDDASKALDGPDDAGSADPVIFVLPTSLNGKTGPADSMIAGPRRLRGYGLRSHDLKCDAAQQKLPPGDH
ncbi:hypothetical protein GGE62_003491 [Rhizobium leguminosarum]|nr:hypothetical protein [Rhizobium leguminosarum]MBB4474446.1 hypothetical protein [Rhizobium leguminosarum]MBB4523428.1 hypothetical protein [Rhizobium leguminosarum]